jgi:hypothetical protein
MTTEICILNLDFQGGLVNQNGVKVTPPSGWAFLPAGDAGVTRKITSAGTYWRVQAKKGRHTYSKGLWAPLAVIEQAKNDMEVMRGSESYKKTIENAARRRESKQIEYEAEFCKAVEEFLNFHALHKNAEKIIAKAVTLHAIPIGSGTVARTVMIPLEERAARAVIAWMRHNTTAYDQLQIKRIKGERRKTRRVLAGQSIEVLTKYRLGLPTDVNCPLQKVLTKINENPV